MILAEECTRENPSLFTILFFVFTQQS